MVQRKKRITSGKYCLLWRFVTAVGIMSALWCQSFVSLADSTGTVTASSAMIRESTDTNSEVVGSASYGNTVTIKDEVQDSSGTLWYQVYVDGNKTGYIRSDLVSKQDGADNGQNTASAASGASVEPDTVRDAQYAVASAATTNVRATPSTNGSVVEQLARDAQVIVSGETEGNDGKLWYYVTFTGTNGAERSGYIRSDLLSLGEMVPMPEETPETQPSEPESEPVTPMNNDYELTHEQNVDGSGSDEWYLYDYTDGQHNKYRVSDLMEVTKARSESAAADAKTLVRQRIAIVVLIILVVGLIAAVVIMALKLRDVYYEEYEDEDEQEQEEETTVRRRSRAEETEETSAQRRRRTEETEEEPVRRRRRTEETEEEPVRRRRRTEETKETSAQRRRRMEDAEDESKSESQVNTAPKRKTKNFLLDDDEFEFEFLNMEDKDL